MKTNYSLLLLTLLMVISCQEQPQYSIRGEIDGIADGEFVYLYDSKTNENIDSVKVTNSQFQIQGHVEEISLYYLVYQPKDERGKYKSVWTDNVPITVKGSVDNFSDMDVQGTEVQEQENEFNELVKHLDERMDSIYRVYDPSDSVASMALKDLYDKTVEEEKIIKINYVKEQSDKFFAVFMLERLIRDMDPEEGQAVFDVIAEDLKSTSWGENINKYLGLNKNLKIGDNFEDISLNTPDGLPVSLAEIANENYVLIDFWASWCQPCRNENPYLVKAYESYKEEGFEIYGVSLDKKQEDWLKAIDEDGIKWTSVIDPEAMDGEPAMVYGVRFIPHNFLIDPDGKIIGIDLRGDDLINKLEEIFRS